MIRIGIHIDLPAPRTIETDGFTGVEYKCIKSSGSVQLKGWLGQGEMSRWLGKHRRNLMNLKVIYFTQTLKTRNMNFQID